MTSAPALGVVGALALALGAGAVPVTSGLRLGRRGLPRLLVGCACLLWGVAQVVTAAVDPGGPGVGPWAGAPVAALLVAAFALLPRRMPEPLDGARLASEAAMFTAALAMLLWRTAFRPAQLAGADTGPVLVLVLVEGFVAGMIFIRAVTDGGRGLLLCAAGGWLYVAGNVAGASTALVTGSCGLLAPAIGAAGLVIVAAGLQLADPSPPELPERQRPRAETRRLVLSTTIPFLMAALGIAISATQDGQVGRQVMIRLALAFMVAFWVRELIRAVQQGRLMRRLLTQVATDPLTGLGNRRALAEALEELYAPPARPCSVLTIDLDGFKDINTQLGHHTGDALLVAVAGVLREECARRHARAFRLGGDEFAVLVASSPVAAGRLAYELVEAIPSGVAAIPGAARVAFSASIGMAHHGPRPPAPATAAAALEAGLADLNRSGTAMRAAKAAGRGRVLAYSTPMAERQDRRTAVERRLRARIAAGGLDLAFQPIISLPELRMTGMETLARWQDEELGVVNPDEFIPVAEDCGLIGELGMQILRRSMQMSIRTGAQAAGLVAGVNISALQLRTNGFVGQVAELLAETGTPPEQFVAEITESVLIGDDDPAVSSLFGLAELGLVIAVDDFGTGYSSLGYLSRLPVRVLKLDRSITRRLAEPRGLAIARCVSDMARALDIDVVAEGIETVDDLTRVRQVGAGFGQGWLFSRAVTEQRFAEFVKDPDLVLAECPALALSRSTG